MEVDGMAPEKTIFLYKLGVNSTSVGSWREGQVSLRHSPLTRGSWPNTFFTVLCVHSQSLWYSLFRPNGGGSGNQCSCGNIVWVNRPSNQLI